MFLGECLEVEDVPGWGCAFTEEGPAGLKVTSSRKERTELCPAENEGKCFLQLLCYLMYELGRELGEKGYVCCSDGWRPCVQGERAILA